MRGYWDIDDYLVEDESIKIIDVEPDILKALYKSQKNSCKNSVPLWLGKILVLRGMGKLLLPSCLSKDFQNALKCEPQIVNYNRYSQDFYKNTSYLAFTHSGSQLVNSIVFIFLCRVKQIFNCLDEGSIDKKSACCKKSKKSDVKKWNWKGRKHEKVSCKHMSLNPRKKYKLRAKRKKL